MAVDCTDESARRAAELGGAVLMGPLSNIAGWVLNLSNGNPVVNRSPIRCVRREGRDSARSNAMK